MEQLLQPPPTGICFGQLRESWQLVAPPISGCHVARISSSERHVSLYFTLVLPWVLPWAASVGEPSNQLHLAGQVTSPFPKRWLHCSRDEREYSYADERVRLNHAPSCSRLPPPASTPSPTLISLGGWNDVIHLSIYPERLATLGRGSVNN